MNGSGDEIEVGQDVVHPIRGEGKITRVWNDGSDTVEVRFSSFGLKSFTMPLNSICLVVKSTIFSFNT